MLIRLFSWSWCLVVFFAFTTSVTRAQEADKKGVAEATSPDSDEKAHVEASSETKQDTDEKHDQKDAAQPVDPAHDTAADAKGHVAGHHEHVGAKGVNKAPEEFRSDLAIFTLLVFCGLMALLSKYAWGPITEALDNRESRIRQDITDAESAKLKSERLVGQHEAKLADVQEEVKAIIAEARTDGESTKADILAAANGEAEATRQRATDDIDHAKDIALKELFDSLSSRITGATEHVLGRTINDSDHERLVDEALAQFSESAGNKS